MPRLTLQRKAFFALTALLAVLLLIFVGFSRLGLQRGLGPYVAEIELARMDWLASRLQATHARDGGWDTLRSRPGLWGEQLWPGDMQQPRRPINPTSQPMYSNGQGPGLRYFPPRFGPDEHREPPEGFMRRRPPADRPPDGPDALPWRLGLLDVAQQLVAGTAPQPGFARTVLRDTDGNVIGHLVLSPPAGLKRDADRAFLSQQLGFVVWTGIAGLVLALLLSWWLSRRWLAPIGALVEGARGIAAGRLDTRVAMHGEDELARLVQVFNDMAEQLASMEASRRQWIGDVAHELRTPLAAMRAEIEALQDGVRTFDPQTALRLHRQVMRLIQLVGDLRASLDADGGGKPATLVPVEPLPLLSEAIASMQPRFAQAGVVLDARHIPLQHPHDERGAIVRGDAQQLHRVFLNLLENSLRYTDPGGELQISAALEHDAGQAVLALRFDDSAPGVAAHELPRIFERLYRAETSRARTTGDLGGSGLGLAICRAIVQAHAGHIHAEPSPLGGLRITLILPLWENLP